MITIKIQINDRIIAEIGAHNIGKPRGIKDLDIRQYCVHQGIAPGQKQLYHRRNDGPVKLAIKMLEVMQNSIIEDDEDNQIDYKQLEETLAELCHSQWSGWMKYLFSKCETTKEKDMIIPEWAVARWLRQSNTDYDELSPEEQESDRVEARKFIKIIQAAVKQELMKAQDGR